jgi:MFS family permease
VSDQRPWLTRNLKIVSAVSLLQDAASELLYPILPILLTTVLGAPAAVVGAVEGIAEGVAAVTKLVAGRLADRYPKVPLVASGYGLAALGKLLIALATVWPVVLAGRAVDRLGKGIRGAPRDALLVHGIPPEARGRAFGFHRMADTTGAVIGPLIGLAGYELLHHHLRPLLWLAVVPAAASALLVFALREPPVARPTGTRGSAASAQLDQRHVERLPHRYWRVVAAVVLFSLVNFPDALLLLRLHDIGFGLAQVMLAYVGYNAVYAALSYPAGVVADRLGPRRVFAAGLVVFAVVYAGLGLSQRHLLAWLLLLGYGAYTGLTDGVGKAWISGLLPRDLQGTGQGVFQGLTGGAVLVAGVWAGLAWQRDGHLPLVVSGAAALVIALALLLAPSRTVTTPQQEQAPA